MRMNIKKILDMFASYVYNIEYDMGGWDAYREEIGVGVEDDYPKSREDFIKDISEEERRICRQIYIDNVAEWGVSDEKAGEAFDEHRKEVSLTHRQKS